MPYAICPGCDEDVYVSNRPRFGAIIACPGCDAKLEVVSVNPVELDWHLEDDEDFDDDDDDYDDD